MKTTKRSFAAIGRRMLHRLAHQLAPNAGTLVMMALLLFAYHAWAAPSAAPQVAPASQVNTGMLSYQGYLTDASDEPLTGDVDITFRLYDAPSGGAALWTEAHTNANAVPVDDGLFNVMLGSLTPISSTVWSSGASYLGVQVGDDAEMSPREAIGNVPTALTVPDGAITREKIGDPTLWRGLNNGATIQSGNVWMTADQTNITIEFEQAFTSTPLVMITQVEGSAGYANLIAHHLTETEFRVAKRDGTACAVHWIAIGDVSP